MKKNPNLFGFASSNIGLDWICSTRDESENLLGLALFHFTNGRRKMCFTALNMPSG